MNSTIRTLLLGATLTTSLMGSAFAQAKLVAGGSEISFVSKQMGVPVEGRFRRFDAQIAFDPKKPEAAKIRFTIDLASVALGAAEVEAEVIKPDWFHTAAHPQASFASASVKAAGANRFDVSGKLTIKGQARDVVVPVTLAPAGSNTLAGGSFVIKRLEYRIGAGDWNDPSLVADEVLVRFKLVVSGLGSP